MARRACKICECNLHLLDPRTATHTHTRTGPRVTKFSATPTPCPRAQLGRMRVEHLCVGISLRGRQVAERAGEQKNWANANIFSVPTQGYPWCLPSQKGRARWPAAESTKTKCILQLWMNARDRGVAAGEGATEEDSRPPKRMRLRKLHAVRRYANGLPVFALWKRHSVILIVVCNWFYENI